MPITAGESKWISFIEILSLIHNQIEVELWSLCSWDVLSIRFWSHICKPTCIINSKLVSWQIDKLYASAWSTDSPKRSLWNTSEFRAHLKDKKIRGKYRLDQASRRSDCANCGQVFENVLKRQILEVNVSSLQSHSISLTDSDCKNYGPCPRAG